MWDEEAREGHPGEVIIDRELAGSIGEILGLLDFLLLEYNIDL